MPNPIKPDHLKVLEGTDRPDRSHPAPEFPPPDSLAPPDWLNGPEAAVEWKRLVELLEPVRIFTEADRTMLGWLCNQHGKLVQLVRAGETPTSAQYSQLRFFYTEFGLTPASRSKAGQVGGEQSRNRWSKFKGGKAAAGGEK